MQVDCKNLEPHLCFDNYWGWLKFDGQEHFQIETKEQFDERRRFHAACEFARMEARVRKEIEERDKIHIKDFTVVEVLVVVVSLIMITLCISALVKYLSF